MTDLRNFQLIETMQAHAGQVPLLSLHLERARSSANALGFVWPESQIVNALEQALASLPAGQISRVRLLVSATGAAQIQTAHLPPTPTPVQLAWGFDTLNPTDLWLQHKTTCRPAYDAAQAWLDRHPEVFDLLYCNTLGHVCEGSRSTLYVRDNCGQWLTPALSCGLLPGVQRTALLRQGLVREAVLTVNDVLEADALRVSNALRGWLDAFLLPGDKAAKGT
jgi:4-amino-4-deoxychorismate lyase